MSLRFIMARRRAGLAHGVVSAGRGLIATGLLALLGCSNEFDATRTVAPRGTLGRELYTVVCDRVGAQSLREDVIGASFHAVCHADPVTAKYADKVDASQLPELHEGSVTPDGQVVPLKQQQANRTYSIARIEALGRRREDVIRALEAALPDTNIPVLPVEGRPCDPPASTTNGVNLHAELSSTLARMIDLYDDAGQTLPSVTRALGRTLGDIKSDPDAQGALARLDARQGYRPIPVALGTVRPLLAYPRLVEMGRAVISPLLAKPGQPATDATRAFDSLLAVGYHELRTSEDALDAGDLGATVDPMVGRAVLTRPRTFLEAAREVVAKESTAAVSASPSYIVERDVRGYAAVPLVNGVVPPPFIDATGPFGGPDGLPDVDALGQFVTSDRAPAVSPFFSRDGRDGARDAFGRATVGTGALMYGYVDTKKTPLAAIARDAKPFLQAGLAADRETAMNAMAALPVLGGSRDQNPATTKVYPPDPRAVEDWKVGHTGKPPVGLGTTPVSLGYRAFHPEDSPVADLVYALGQVLAQPEMDDMLALAQSLFTAHPEQLANLFGLALEIRKIAAAHPEAQLSATSTFFDDLFVQLSHVSHEPGLLEDIVRAFADPKTLAMEGVLTKFFSLKDDVAYDTANLNGPSRDLDTGVAPPNFQIPVDRTQPDVGANRSEMQKFLQLLHDTNGLSICTKDGAIVHIRATLPNTTIPINFDYPTDPIYTPLVCGIVGKPAPAHLARCAVFGYQNVMSLLLDVLLGKAQLTVQDPCLNALLNSSLTGLVGGADAFLQVISGVDGFSLHPNLRGFARLLYFQTPYPGLPTDTNPANTLTSNFLKDTIDPIESMVCDPTPFTTPDGTVYPLRKCKAVEDVLRARDPDALFPVDELGFVASLQPLAGAFDKHAKPLLFADLFDVLHEHWGSAAQPKSVCDPTLARTNARWCSQDGLVTWEPLFTEVLQNGVFARLQSFVQTLATMKVAHCTEFDAATHLCKTKTDYDGVHVVSEALGLMLDPARMPGLADRHGGTFAARNDGQQTDPLTAMDLLVDALNSVDRSFASFSSAHPGDAARQAKWRAARSAFVDTFFTVNGQGPSAQFQNDTLIQVVPRVIGVLRDQVAAHCPPVGAAPGATAAPAACTWAQRELTADVVDSLGGPTFAAAVDLLDVLRTSDAARGEIERLVTYLLDAASGNDAQAGVLAALLDAMQIFADQTNLTPFEKVLARTVQPPITDEAGNVVRRSLADGALRSLDRIFAVDTVGTGDAACTRERDPNRAIGALLAGLVTPMATDQPTPVELIMSAIADVNRADRHQATKLTGTDYGNIANEMGTFCLDSTRGLEQFYTIIRQITEGS